MEVKNTQPADFKAGAYRVEITLSEDEAQLLRGAPVMPFDIPRLPHRSIIIDPGFSIAVRGLGAVSLRGRFVNGVWNGRLYSNGVAENDNPTSIEEVQAALGASASQVVEIARAWVDHASGRLR